MPTIANTTNHIDLTWLDRRHGLVMEYIARASQTWKRLAAAKGENPSHQLWLWANTTRAMRNDIWNICTDLLLMAPCPPNALNRNTPTHALRPHQSADVFALYIGYINALTQDKLDNEQLVTIVRQWSNGNALNFEHLRLDEVIDTLKRGTDVVYVANYLCGCNAYRRRRKDDVIPNRLVEDFEKYGGLEMVDAINAGIPLNDIIGGVRR